MSNQSGSRGPNEPFEYDGTWHVYDDTGRLFRWDAGAQAWGAAPPDPTYQPPPAQPYQPYGYQQPPTAYQQPPTAYQQPQAATRVASGGYAAPSAWAPAFSTLRTPAIWVYVCLAATIAFSLLYIGGAIAMISAASDAENATSFDEFSTAVDATETADDVIAAGQGLQGFAIIATAAVFIWWTRRATCNVPALGVSDPNFTPGWSIGWWFIPFANWVQPLRVINQAWRASDPAVAQSLRPWRSAGVGAVVIVWWLAWLIGGIATAGATSAYDDAVTWDEVRGAATAVVICELVLVAAGVLAIVVVRQLTARQELAAQLRGTQSSSWAG